MSDLGELTVSSDAVRVPLQDVQAATGQLIALVLKDIVEDEQAEAQRKIARHLDKLVAEARPARPRERVLSGREAVLAARAIVLADEPWEEGL